MAPRRIAAAQRPSRGLVSVPPWGTAQDWPAPQTPEEVPARRDEEGDEEQRGHRVVGKALPPIAMGHALKGAGRTAEGTGVSRPRPPQATRKPRGASRQDVRPKHDGARADKQAQGPPISASLRGRRDLHVFGEPHRFRARPAGAGAAPAGRPCPSRRRSIRDRPRPRRSR